MSDTAYNGWKNYETWNVALWIGNDEGLHDTARECGDYHTFCTHMADSAESFDPAPAIYHKTPDGIGWSDSGLDTDALDDMIRELGE